MGFAHTQTVYFLKNEYVKTTVRREKNGRLFYMKSEICSYGKMYGRRVRRSRTGLLCRQFPKGKLRRQKVRLIEKFKGGGHARRLMEMYES